MSSSPKSLIYRSKMKNWNMIKPSNKTNLTRSSHIWLSLWKQTHHSNKQKGTRTKLTQWKARMWTMKTLMIGTGTHLDSHNHKVTWHPLPKSMSYKKGSHFCSHKIWNLRIIQSSSKMKRINIDRKLRTYMGSWVNRNSKKGV